MMNHTLALLSFTGVLVLLWLLLVLLVKEGAGNHLVRTFLLVCTGVIVWNAGYTVMYFTTDPQVAWDAYRFSALGWGALPIVTFHMIWLLWNYWSHKEPQKWVSWALLVPGLYLSWMGITGDLLALSLSPASVGWKENITFTNPGAWVFLLSALGALVFTSLVFFAKAPHFSQKKYTKQMLFIVVPAVLTSCLALLVNILFPWFGVREVPALGNLLVTLWFIFVGYALTHFPILSMTPEYAAPVVIEQMSEPLVLIDDTGVVRHGNPALGLLLGWDVKTLEGQNFYSWMVGEGPEASASGSKGEDRRFFPEEMGQLNRDLNTATGSIPVSLSYHRLRDRFGDPVGDVILLHDRRDYQRLEHLATTDFLTGLTNRGRGEEVLSLEAERFRRYGRPFSLIMIDIDHFKRINDQAGHPKGDEVLVEVSRRMVSVLRSTDLPCRWGGEEFLILCPETVMGQALNLAHRVLQQAQNLDSWPGPEGTLSLGVAEAKVGEPLEELLDRVDRELYMAKSLGRNRVFPERNSLPPGTETVS